MIGCPGPRGEKGREGCQGEKGKKGCRGKTGKPGATGATGATGETGETGATGATGATGSFAPLSVVTYVSETIQNPLVQENIDPSKVSIDRDLVSVQVAPNSFMNTLRLTVKLAEGAILVPNVPAFFIVSVFQEHPFTDYSEQNNSLITTSADSSQVIPSMSGGFIFQAGLEPNNLLFAIQNPVSIPDGSNALFSTVVFNYFSNL